MAMRTKQYLATVRCAGAELLVLETMLFPG